MADDVILAAQPGRTTGSSASRRLRADGKVPAVLYGRGAEPAPLTVAWRDLRSALTTDKGLNALLTIDVGGKQTKAIVKEIQRHPVRRDVLHVDFLSVDVDKPITTDVPIVLEGEATLVLREEGVVEQALNAIVVHAKPDAIPGHLAVDVSELEIGHTITVADLVLPPGVTTDADPEETVVTAKHAAVEEEPEPVEGEEGEEAAEGEGAEGEAAEGGEAPAADAGGE
jgi:large subunit ribosomal protein L25